MEEPWRTIFLELISQEGNLVIFMDSDLESAKGLAQFGRIFTVNFLPWHDECNALLNSLYLVTSDADLIPLMRDVFVVPEGNGGVEVTASNKLVGVNLPMKVKIEDKVEGRKDNFDQRETVDSTWITDIINDTHHYSKNKEESHKSGFWAHCYSAFKNVFPSAKFGQFWTFSQQFKWPFRSTQMSEHTVPCPSLHWNDC